MSSPFPLRNPAFAGAPACGTAPGHLPRIHCATPGEPGKSRAGCAGLGGVGRGRRRTAATRQLHARIQAAPRGSRAARAAQCASHRKPALPPQPGLRSTGRVGVAQGLRHKQRHPGDDTGQKDAQREPCAGAAAGEGHPRPRHATVRGGAHSGAPCTSCSVHAARHSAALPGPAFVPAGPRCLFWSPGPRRGWGRSSASPLSSQGRARTCARSRATAQLRRGLAFAPPLSLLPLSLPPSLPPGRTAPVPGSGWFILRPRITFIYKLCQSRPSFHFGTGTGGLFSKSLFLIAPALQITSGNLGEEPSGWKMLLRFA